MRGFRGIFQKISPNASPKKKAQSAFFVTLSIPLDWYLVQKTADCAGILIRQGRGSRALFGTIIIHYPERFVNIHFVRFFVAIFGEKYSMKILSLFVAVIFVDFVQCRFVVVVSQRGCNVSPEIIKSFFSQKVAEHAKKCYNTR